MPINRISEFLTPRISHPLNSRELVAYLRKREPQDSPPVIVQDDSDVCLDSHQEFVHKMSQALLDSQISRRERRRILREELEDFAGDFVKDFDTNIDLGLGLEITEWNRRFESCGLSLQKELLALYEKKDNTHNKRRVLDAMLLFGEGSSSSIYLLLKRGDEICVDFLRSLDEKTLKEFVCHIIELQKPAEIHTLVPHLRKIAEPEWILTNLLTNVKEVARNKYMESKKVQMRYIRDFQLSSLSFMEMLDNDELPLEVLEEAYSTAITSKVRDKACELLFNRYPDLAVTELLNYAKGDAKIKTLQPKKHANVESPFERAVRFDSLKRYTRLLKRDAVNGLRTIVEDGQDPFLTLMACEGLAKGSYCGLKGKRALVDIVVEDAHNDIPSVTLANLVWNPEKKDLILKAIFSTPRIDLGKTFQDLDEIDMVYVDESKGKPTSCLMRPGTQDLIKMLGIGRLVRWMNSHNVILRKNATKVLGLVSDENITEFLLKGKKEDALLLKKLADVSGETCEYPGTLYKIDSNRHGRFLVRLRNLISNSKGRNRTEEMRTTRTQQNLSKDLENTIADIVLDDSAILYEVNHFRAEFEDSKLSLEDTLIQMYRDSDPREIGKRQVILKMLLILGKGYSKFLLKELTNIGDDKQAAVDLLKAMPKNELSDFLTKLPVGECLTITDVNLAMDSLLEALGEKRKKLLQFFIRKLTVLPINKSIPDDIRDSIRINLERFILSALKKIPREELNLKEVSNFYNIVIDESIRKETAELLMGYFGHEAIPVFLEALKDTRDFTIRDFKSDYLPIQTHRERRFESLIHYVELAREGAINTLGEILASDRDPILILEACDLLTNKDVFGEEGKQVLFLEAYRQIEDERTLTVLASLLWAVNFNSIGQDCEAVLKQIFSMEIGDFERQLLRTNKVALPKIDKDSAILTKIVRPGMHTLIKNLGLNRLVDWLKEDNPVLQRNAMTMINHFSENEIEELLSSSPENAEFLRDFVDGEYQARLVRNSVSGRYRAVCNN